MRVYDEYENLSVEDDPLKNEHITLENIMHNSCVTTNRWIDGYII